MQNISKPQDCVELKERGMFYGAVDDSARVICALTGYKPQLRKKGKIECGFPRVSLEKVESALVSAQIDYRIWSKNAESNNELECISENHFTENHFNDYVQRFEPRLILDAQNSGLYFNNNAVQKSPDISGDNISRQICEYVQGQGLTMESAVMDFQGKIQNMYINQGLQIDTVSFISNQAGNNALYMIQGLIIYRKRG